MNAPAGRRDAGDGALFEYAPCGLLSTDDSGLILRANATLCEWLARSAETLVERVRFPQLLTVGGRIFHYTHCLPLLRMQGSLSEVKLGLLLQDGTSIPVVMSAVRRERGGAVVHDIALFIAKDRDAYERELLAARKQAEHLLAEREHERDERRAAAEDRALFSEQLIGIVSHDLRNPLSTIRLGTEMLQALDLPDRYERILENIDHAGGRAAALINDLLDFTLVRLGKGLSVVPILVDVHQVVSAQVADLSQAFPDARIEHRAEGDGSCTVDPDRLTQLVSNLVSNAIAYGTPGAPITVLTKTRAGHLWVSVRNSGEPIPETRRAALFRPMVRGSTEGGKNRSVGLGLYIVSEVARAHGGEVQVLSNAEHGTEFIVSFPCLHYDAA